jgi:hypothetical protein
MEVEVVTAGGLADQVGRNGDEGGETNDRRAEEAAKAI